MYTKGNLRMAFIALAFLSLFGCREDAITLESFGAISGQITDSESFLPLQGVSISTTPTTTTIVSDSTGQFQISHVEVGDYSIRLEKNGYVTEFESISVTRNNIVEIDIDMVKGESENLPPPTPELLLPLDEATDLGDEVEITWTIGNSYVEDDLLFDVVIFDNSGNERLIENHPDTSFLIEDLNFNTRYFWYVIAKDGVNPRVNSEIFSFNVRELSDNLFLFVRTVNDLMQIFSSDPDGMIETPITENNTNNWCPQFSPDGTLISYVSVVNNQNHLFVADKDGNNSRKVTSGVSIDYFDPLEMDYCWSPDGTKILYMNFDKLYLQDINVSGGPANAVLTSSDGNAIASCDWNGNKVLIRTTNSEGFESRFYLYNTLNWQLEEEIAYFPTGRTGGPYFSHNGNSAVYTHDIHPLPTTLQGGSQDDAEIFYIANINTNPSEAISLSDEFKPAGTNDLNPRFSPSGAFIIFTNYNIDGLELPSIQRLNISLEQDRSIIFQNAIMPDWKMP